jgi:hypothetical protein
MIKDTLKDFHETVKECVRFINSIDYVTTDDFESILDELATFDVLLPEKEKSIDTLRLAVINTFTD